MSHEHNANKKRFWVYTCTLILVIICGVVLFNAGRRGSKRSQELSAMGEIHATLREELPKYYEANGFYPTNLLALQIRSFGDGADPSMLTNFAYETDGTNFFLKWKTPQGREVYLQGQSGPITRDDW